MRINKVLNVFAGEKIKPMNIKLVDSILTIIDSLTPEERELLESSEGFFHDIKHENR
ncbi:MAG: hypothetical protein Kow0091_06000 [Geminocystis sp.]